MAGSLLAILVAIICSYVVYGALKATVGIRLDEEDEYNGPDQAIHKIGAYPEDSIR